MKKYSIKDTGGNIKRVRKYISPALYILFGAAAGILPRYLVCSWTSEKGFMQCWETAKIMSLLGIIFVFAGVIKLLAKKSGIKTGIDISVMITALLGILVPAKLVGGCLNMGMSCHTVAFPFIYALMICIEGIAFICVIREAKRSFTLKRVESML